MERCIRFIYCSLVAFMVFYPGVVFSIPNNDEDTVIASKKVKKVASATKDVDSDGDGVPDSEDECPSIPGPVATNGCPDSDGDGIPDHLDDCPTVFGLAQYRGCPDTDLDGIPDNKDVCPYEPGPASNNGCPLSDNSKQIVIAKVVDTINFNEERDMQLMRYERYLYEQEFKQEIPEVKEKTRFVADNIEEKNRKPEVGNKQEKTEPKIASSVMINSVQFQSFKPKLEALLKDMRFQNGRVLFVDENKFFEALHELASYCASYPEWVKIVFHCYSNETDNAFGNKQLFSNRAHALKQILVSDLNISEHRLDFVNKINSDSNVSNYISLEINSK